MKKIAALIVLVIIAAIGMLFVPTAADDDIELRLQIDSPVMSVNSNAVNLDSPPVTVNGRTLVPIRAVIEGMGGAADWDNYTRTVLLTYGDNTIKLVINNTTAYLNDEAKMLDTPPQIINGRTMLPIRFVAESFGFNADWEQSSRTVIITKAETAEVTETTTRTEPSVLTSSGKTLVAYFTWSGNTKEMAEYIADKTGADIFVIEPQTPYPTDYNECGELAKTERDENARPTIKDLPDNLNEYDTIYIGYPIWWHTAPMIIGTFLESSDFSGVDIYPFTQSAAMETEHFNNSMDFIRDCAKSATVHDGLYAKHNDTKAIDEYLQILGS